MALLPVGMCSTAMTMLDEMLQDLSFVPRMRLGDKTSGASTHAPLAFDLKLVSPLPFKKKLYNHNLCSARWIDRN